MTTPTPRYCIANVSFHDGSVSPWAVESDGETITLVAPDSSGPGASQVHRMTYDDFRSLTGFVWDQEIKPAPTCGCAPVGHDAPAVALLRLARGCGHDGYWLRVCAEHAAVMPIGCQAERETECTVCATSNRMLVTETRPIGGAS